MNGLRIALMPGPHCAVLTTLLSLTPILAAQEIIRSNVRLVIASVTVLDRGGRFVNGLTANDFLLYDNHRLQKTQVDVSDTAFAPVSIAIVVETSSVAAAALAKIRKVGSMIQPLITGERGEAAVLAAGKQVKVLQQFTASPDQIANAIRNLKADDCIDGKFIDGVLAGARVLQQRPRHSRRIILLISESRDRGSTATISEAIAAAQQQDITVYALTYSGYVTPFSTRPEDLPHGVGGDNINLLAAIGEIGRLAKTNTASALTASTGGASFSFARLKSLEKRIADLGQELHSQYLLSFSPARSGDSRFHSLDIKIKDRPDLTIRARPGYWPLADSAPVVSPEF